VGHPSSHPTNSEMKCTEGIQKTDENQWTKNMKWILSTYSRKCEIFQNYQTLHHFTTQILSQNSVFFKCLVFMQKFPEICTSGEVWYYNQLIELTRHIMQIQRTTILASWRFGLISVCSTFNRWTSVLRPTASSTASEQFKTLHEILDNS